jgi:uncharacterized protein (TIGR03066 family)
MQRLMLLTALLATVFFTSCKKEKSTAELLEGKWKVTRLIADGEDVILGDDDYKTAVELEFTNSGSVLFHIKELDLTTAPPTTESFVFAGTYTLSGDDNLTFVLSADGENMAVTGTLNLTDNKLTFTGTSGDVEDFISVLEAERL